MPNYTKLILILLIIFAGCASNKNSQKQTDKPQLSHAIIFGTSGGFTGLNQGFYIDTAGAVKSFRGIVFESAEKEYKGELNPDQITELNTMMKDITGIHYTEKGNMTSYIRLTNPNTNLSLSWAGTSPDSNVPGPVKNFYEKLNTMVKSLK